LNRIKDEFYQNEKKMKKKEQLNRNIDERKKICSKKQYS